MKVILKNEEIVLGLAQGVVYGVIGIDDLYYRVVNCNQEPVLYEKERFVVVDPHIPEDWVLREYEDGEYYLDPPEFSKVGFFEDLFDGRKDAKIKYNRYLSLHGLKKP